MEVEVLYESRENGHSCIKIFKEAQFLIAQIGRCMLKQFRLWVEKTWEINTVAYYEILKLKLTKSTGAKNVFNYP